MSVIAYFDLTNTSHTFLSLLKTHTQHCSPTFIDQKIEMIPTWTTLVSLANNLAKGATGFLILIYVAYYLKKGGFETAPLEITLAGAILLLLTTALINIIAPAEIKAFEDRFKFEAFTLEQFHKKHTPTAYFDPQIESNPITKAEAQELGYIFDEAFGYSTKDLKATLGETGYIALATKIIFLRINKKKATERFLATIAIAASLILMYSKPLGMLAEIYLSRGH